MKRGPSDLLDPEFLSRLERLELNARRLVSGERRGDVATRRRGSGTLFREHRPYVAGDDPRFLDWNAYLRLGHLQVKEQESEESPRLLLLVDRSASMSLRDEARLDQALKLAAAIGAIALLRHVVTTVRLFPGGARRTFRGQGALVRFLEYLSPVEASGAADFLSSFQEAAPRDRPGGIAVVISDFYETEQYASGLRFLRHRGFHGHALHVCDERDRRVRSGDLVDLVDVETGELLRERIDRQLAADYAEALADHYRVVEETCQGLQVPYVRVDVNDPMERVVMDLMRRGALVS